MKKKQQKVFVSAVSQAVDAVFERNKVSDPALRSTLLNDIAQKLTSSAAETPLATAPEAVTAV